MAQTQHTGDGDDRTREQPRYAAPQDAAASHGGRGATGGQDAAQTPAAGHGHPAAGAPSQAPEGDFGTVGEGRYRLHRRLGRGGMAEVFAAQDLRLGRTVAVKLLRPELAQDDVARLRFTREAHSVAALNHHAVVSVYDTGEEALAGGETMPYIVMELVEGHTVRELLADEEAPPVDQALIIIAGVLEALAYSHRHGIVHRDIKPANVIITTTGAVKVMDFGIARALTGAASTMTQTGMVMGTPQYLSPEQALGKAVDHRSDLYATGCMLYELLTLRPPFTGDTPLSVVYQHVQDNPVPPSQANHRVPPQLDGLVLRSLAKDPDDRFQTADEFRAHVQQALREMHGAGGAGYAASAAAAGLAAAGTPGSGTYPGYQGTPSAGSQAATEQLSASTPPMGTPPTVIGYPRHDTPPTAAYGVGGPGGPGGYGGDRDGRGRNPLVWVGLAAAAVLAVVLGIVFANFGGSANHKDNPTTSLSPSVSQSSSPAETPSPTDTQPSETAGTSNENPGGGYTTSYPPTSSKPSFSSPSAPASPSSAPPSASSSPTPSSTPTSSATASSGPTGSTDTGATGGPGGTTGPTGPTGGAGGAGGAGGGGSPAAAVGGNVAGQ